MRLVVFQLNESRQTSQLLLNFRSFQVNHLHSAIADEVRITFQMKDPIV